jgi:hypothetical protein
VLPDHHNGQAHAAEGTRTETSLDELARGLAAGTISRGRALRLLGGLLVSAAVGGLSPREALAEECTEVSVDGKTYTEGDCGEDTSRDRFARRCRRRGGTVCRTPDGRRCVNTNRDENHCGECGNRCRANETCCGGRCVNTNRDEDHCGRCGSRCRRNETCVDGRCVRRESVCVSKRYCNDNYICCQDSEVCISGQCVHRSECPPERVCGEDCCEDLDGCIGGRCRSCDEVCGWAINQCYESSGEVVCCDMSFEDRNCCRPDEICHGSCCASGTFCCNDSACCPDGEICQEGIYGSCCPPEDVCGSECCDGSSGVCCAGRCCRNTEICVSGQCTCPEGQTLCGAFCVDTSTDPANCGGCRNRCSEGQYCSNGTCVACADTCSPGTTCVAGACCPEERTCLESGSGCYGPAGSGGNGGCADLCCPEGTECVGYVISFSGVRATECCPVERVCGGYLTRCCPEGTICGADSDTCVPA